MAIVKPFRALRPTGELASSVAALPYDVYSRAEARQAVAGKPLSFLNIDRPETQFPPDADMYSDEVYEKAGEILKQWQQEGILLEEEQNCYYLYELEWQGRVQTGFVGCSAVTDYESGVIRRHENTREDKELDRIHHVEVCNAHTGPIFLAYRYEAEIDGMVQTVRAEAPLYNFTGEDGVRHTVWRIAEPELIQAFEAAFEQVPRTYIADGHHRAASAARVAQHRRAAAEATGDIDLAPGGGSEDPSQYFLSVLFPDVQLAILPYHRVVKDLNGLSKEAFLEQLTDMFTVELLGDAPYQPERKGRFGMYLDGQWYRLTPILMTLQEDPVAHLDVSVLQQYLLAPILGIEDPRTDSRVEFIGGIRGLSELRRRVDQDMAVAFSLYPTSMEELLAVADQGMLMPPKSTWFEPKLRSGLLMHKI